MSLQSLRPRDETRNSTDVDHAPLARRDEALVVRNYDGRRSHRVTVRFLDADDEIALERSYRLAPGDVVSISSRLDRGVYRVEARIEDDESVGVECLVGSGPAETALVEVGNGLVSVSEGL
jgi:hypothetical protein